MFSWTFNEKRPPGSFNYSHNLKIIWKSTEYLQLRKSRRWTPVLLLETWHFFRVASWVFSGVLSHLCCGSVRWSCRTVWSLPVHFLLVLLPAPHTLFHLASGVFGQLSQLGIRNTFLTVRVVKLEQAAQRSCRCPITGNVASWVGSNLIYWKLSLPMAIGTRWSLMSLPTQNHSMILWSPLLMCALSQNLRILLESLLLTFSSSHHLSCSNILLPYFCSRSSF